MKKYWKVNTELILLESELPSLESNIQRIIFLLEETPSWFWEVFQIRRMQGELVRLKNKQRAIKKRLSEPII